MKLPDKDFYEYLRWTPDMVQQLSDCIWTVARRELRRELKRDVQELIDKTSATGHGKAQRVFGLRVIEVIERVRAEG